MTETGKMYDVMLDEASLWYGESSNRKRKFEKAPVYSPPSPVDDDDYYFSDEDMDPVEQETYHRQVVESLGFDVDCFKHTFNGIIPVGYTCYEILYARVGLHCYNLEKGKKLQFKNIVKANGEIGNLYNAYTTSEVIDPVDNSVHTFQAMVTDAGKEKKARLILVTIICRIKPQIPGPGDASAFWDSDAIDDFYKCDLPDWPLNDALTGDDKLNLYEVKKSELEENEWLYLYAEAALFSEWHCDMVAHKPFEIKKVMVQTKENVESSLKLKSSNAIFYVKFKAHGGPWCRGIIRRTSDGRTGHMCLEARCWIDKCDDDQ